MYFFCGKNRSSHDPGNDCKRRPSLLLGSLSKGGALMQQSFPSMRKVAPVLLSILELSSRIFVLFCADVLVDSLAHVFLGGTCAQRHFWRDGQKDPKTVLAWYHPRELLHQPGSVARLMKSNKKAASPGLATRAAFLQSPASIHSPMNGGALL